MKRRENQRLQQLTREAANNISLLHGLLLQAPRVVAGHQEFVDRLFLETECKLVAINCGLIREV